MPAQTLYDLTLEAQEAELASRREELKARMLMSARQAGIYKATDPDQVEGFRSAVTGAGVVAPRVKRSVLASLTPLIADTRDAYDQSQLARDQSDYSQRAQADAQRLIGEMPRQTPGTPGRTEYATGAGAYDIPGTPPSEPTLRDQLEWAMRARANPALRPTADAFVTDRIVREPDRVEAREERKLTREEARAEAKRKQREELQYRRERDEQANELRATIAQLIHGGKSGGSSGSQVTPITLDAEGNALQPWSRKGIKAADIIRTEAPDGTVTLVDKLSNETRRIGALGKGSTTHEKTLADEATKVKNAREGLVLLRQMEPLLSTATSSNLGALRDAAGGVVGWSGKAGDAAGELSNMGANLVSLIDRAGLGPQFSDSDLKFLINKSGGLGDPTIPESRKRAVYTRVLGQFQRAAGEPSREASGKVDSQPVPGSDMLRQPTPSAPRRKFNPATGRVE